MGVALAEEASARGAEVTLLAGPMDVPPPEGMAVERIVTATELAAAAERLFPECDVLVMAAAVGDFRAAEPQPTKLRRGKSGLQIRLSSNPDILAALAARRRSGQILVGFALETEDAEKGGREKLEGKGVDLMVVNNPREPGAAIGGETNLVTLLERGKAGRRLPVLPKPEVARRIFDWVVARRGAPLVKDGRERSARRARGA
jgi:phosphopantothenoylcysteine decarboxylase/phosphopantothenate--cysteine ligase